MGPVLSDLTERLEANSRRMTGASHRVRGGSIDGIGNLWRTPT